MAAICLGNMNWKMGDGVSPTLSRPWNSMAQHGCLLICQFLRRHSTDPWRSLNHLSVSIKNLLKVIGCGNFSVGHTFIKVFTSHGHQLDGDETVGAPLSCYIVKWRNKQVAIKGLVQRTNLISSYNRNKKLL